MTSEESQLRRMSAAEEFDLHEHRSDGVRLVPALADGLTMLRDLAYARVHDDVEQRMGTDSMLAPISAEKTERLTKAEIELYQIVVSFAAVREHAYVAAQDEWYLQWLARLRLGKMMAESRTSQRLQFYLSKTSDARRLAFSNILASAVPESRRAPLVLFRLLPMCAEVVTCLAFGDLQAAAAVRNCQVHALPAIRDCHACRGRLLENGEYCHACGNPLWKFEWLISAD
ncbi:MAG: hypothetical protein ABSG68_03190 [Thermoguttaceae bacterium]|jgi:hypothetical protein